MVSMYMYYCALMVVLAIGGVSTKSPCCYPDQWEAQVGGSMDSVHEGKPQSISYFMPRFSVDFKAMKVALQELDYGEGWMVNTTVIIDYKAKTQWIINWKKCLCNKQSTAGQAQRCIPNNWKYTNTFQLGLQKNTLTVDNWIGPLGGAYASYLVASDTCMLVTEYVRVGGQVPTVITSGLFNVTLGIKDPSVFDPPSFCQKEAPLKSIVHFNQLANYWINRFNK